MLCDALRVEKEATVFQVDPLLEEAALLEVVMEAKDLDSSRCLGVPLDRRMKMLILVAATRELADRGVRRVAQFHALLGVLGGGS